MAKKDWTQCKALQSKIHSPNVTPAEKWLGYLLESLTELINMV